MKNDKELFRKFFRGECTGEEAAAVQAYFDEHPGELENYFPLNDWLSDSAGHLDASASERILQQVRDTYEQEKCVPVLKSLLRYAVAASLIGITLFAGIKMLPKSGKVTRQSKFVTTSNARSVQTLRTVENRTKQVILVSLSDGSLVTIYPRSSLSYLPEFETGKRELHLSGKALFKVSKDKSRPFTVYAGGIATTALGTVFLVSESKGRKVSVALMEGSIKVWEQKSDRKDSVVLQPGDNLVVTSGNFKGHTLKKKVKKNAQNIREEITVNAAKEKNALVFKNDRLKDVFKNVGDKFAVTIKYDAVAGIENESFTGTFLENDSLEFICKTISNMYGLQYRKEGNMVTILKF